MSPSAFVWSLLAITAIALGYYHQRIRVPPERASKVGSDVVSPFFSAKHRYRSGHKSTTRVRRCYDDSKNQTGRVSFAPHDPNSIYVTVPCCVSVVTIYVGALPNKKRPFYDLGIDLNATAIDCFNPPWWEMGFGSSEAFTTQADPTDLVIDIGPDIVLTKLDTTPGLDRRGWYVIMHYGSFYTSLFRQQLVDEIQSWPLTNRTMTTLSSTPASYVASLETRSARRLKAAHWPNPFRRMNHSIATYSDRVTMCHVLLHVVTVTVPCGVGSLMFHVSRNGEFTPYDIDQSIYSSPFYQYHSLWCIWSPWGPYELDSISQEAPFSPVPHPKDVVIEFGDTPTKLDQASTDKQGWYVIQNIGDFFNDEYSDQLSDDVRHWTDTDALPVQSLLTQEETNALVVVSDTVLST